MKKKILIIIFIILVILLAILCVLKIKRVNLLNNTKETSRDFILNDNTTSKVNTNGENSGIYVGTNENGKDNYLFISIKIDKKASKENQIKSLISSISTATGYKIDINSVNISRDEIKIDFAKTAAPFELEESYHYSDAQQYFVTADFTVAKTLFDSINKTLKSYFGNDTKIYFSADSENINIENEYLSIHLDSNKSYDEQ